MIDHLMWKDVRRAVLAWPGGRSIRDYDEPNAVDTTLLVAVADLLADVPRAQELFALAEKADWSPAAAGELLGLIEDWRATNDMAIGAWHEEKAHAAGAEGAREEAQQQKAADDIARNEKAAESRIENQRAEVAAALRDGRAPERFPPLQGSVLKAEFDLGKKFDPDNAGDVAQCMQFLLYSKQMNMVRIDNVKTAIRKLRAKGL